MVAQDEAFDRYRNHNRFSLWRCVAVFERCDQDAQGDDFLGLMILGAAEREHRDLAWLALENLGGMAGEW